MKLKFSDNSIKEYYEGGYHFINDGQTIEVSNAVGVELLKARHIIAEDKAIPVFIEVAPGDEKKNDDGMTDDKSAKKEKNK